MRVSLSAYCDICIYLKAIFLDFNKLFSASILKYYTTMQLVLIGYMGSGKTTVGSLLSKVMEVPFIDLDAHIEAQEEATVTSIFKNKGEIYFRKKEAIYLQEVLNRFPKLVIATGGGTPCYGTIIADLKANEDVHLFYLKYGVEALTERLWLQKEQRPLIAHIPNKALLNDFIRKHLFERGFYYNQSHTVIDCEALSPGEIVEKIVLKLF